MKEKNTLEGQFEIIPASATALDTIERANIDMQISTAKRYPRSLAVVKKRMMELATLDQETASSCIYAISRSGKTIKGPSIRLAEIAGSSFGNLRYGARVIANDGKMITAQAYCHDLETNVFSQIEVQRRITDRYGNTYSDDMQVVTGNAACAIAARNAIFKVVPFAFVKPIFEAAKRAAVGDAKTLKERRASMLEQFKAIGVNEKRICRTLEKAGIEEIGLDDLETLIGLFNAIKDGEQTINEAFPAIIIERAKVPEVASGGGESKGEAVSGVESAEPVKPPPSRESESHVTAWDNFGEGGEQQTPPPEETPPTGKGGKLSRKKKENKVLGQIDAGTMPNRVEMEKRLNKGGCKPEHLMSVALANDWIQSDETWPLAEEKLARFLTEENWPTIVEELEAFKK